MSTSTQTPVTFSVFAHEHWASQLPALAPRYQGAQPFPNIQLQDFLEAEALARAIREFPAPADPAWIHYKHYNENKVGMTRLDLFPPSLRHIVEELNSPAFVKWLSQLTGIEGLIADPALDGGGMHQSARGGFLNVHADFTVHHHHPDWRRRVNLIVYLNPEWKEEWGGAIELWDEGMKRCVSKMLPLANRALIFNTGETSYHGFPDALRCPEDVTRKSIALYYYTVETARDYVPKSTDYRARPSDSSSKAAMIWFDKKMVSGYSKVKSALGLSDDFAGKILRVFSRKKHPRP